MLLHLDRRTLTASSTESAAWLGSRGPKSAGEEPVFALYFHNQVDGNLTIVGINGAHYRGGDHQLLSR